MEYKGLSVWIYKRKDCVKNDREVAFYIKDLVIIQENTRHENPVFWHILRSDHQKIESLIKKSVQQD